ncbi:hypothetical protein [Paenibacillus sp. L3-i20]|uniref:hypothetical protein n=1 Tax=Paenibacillus sp. L3-i20 TaxID=2905833 RepID=UPI002085F206|nr:hypothetical protein [Paenibacillus sp. L3-i20]GKU77405.1 hypothetical protein L3i20_v218020 [Paenibacillus sp. L3-i20]
MVIPSVPGFGFSMPLSTPGWTPGRVAGVFTKLMGQLGYDRYGIQGGDTGSFVAPEMGQQDADHVIGIHVNALLTFPIGVKIISPCKPPCISMIKYSRFVELIYGI